MLTATLIEYTDWNVLETSMNDEIKLKFEQK